MGRTSAHPTPEGGNPRVEVHTEGPIEQFKVLPIIPIRIGGLDRSFTNAALFMVLTLICVTAVLLLGSRRQAVGPSRVQSSVELVYDFVDGTMREILGKHGSQFFPLIFTLFMFI